MFGRLKQRLPRVRVRGCRGRRSYRTVASCLGGVKSHCRPFPTECCRHPIARAPIIQSGRHHSPYKAMALLESLGVLREITGKWRDCVYAYYEHLQNLTGNEE